VGDSQWHRVDPADVPANQRVRSVTVDGRSVALAPCGGRQTRDRLPQDPGFVGCRPGRGQRGEELVRLCLACSHDSIETSGEISWTALVADLIIRTAGRGSAAPLQPPSMTLDRDRPEKTQT
jgi:hypothetical protein